MSTSPAQPEHSDDQDAPGSPDAPESHATSSAARTPEETADRPDTADEQGDAHSADTPDDATPGSDDGDAATGAQGDAEDEQVSADTSEAPRLPESLTFRITPVALLVVLTVAVCASPAAAAIPWLSVLYLVPLGLLVWILRVRTTVHGSGLTVRTVTGKRQLDWNEIRSLHLDERRWVRAVTQEGTEVRLPAVRVRDLPRLAAMSGGRLSNPDEPADDAPPEESA